ncbi:MAG TPA: hypothetical protein VFU74_22110 [Actinocrinis sp.]|nr:hypothetical protein [Actinocrinis sp.]
MSTPTLSAGLDADGMTADERRQYETRQAVRALGLLLQMIPADVQVFEWRILHDYTIEVMPHHLGTDHEKRFLIRRLANTLPGFEFVERPHSATLNHTAAAGTVGGVEVRLWFLLKPCTCQCHGSV